MSIKEVAFLEEGLLSSQSK